jgi:dTDP-4-amino-4,6-dideoxygalactose transaminase
MRTEIGSEFWEAELSTHFKPICKNSYEFLLSGRTALDFIIRDIKESAGFEIVYMPSYCCHTMIQPFIENGIEVKFYDIGFADGRYTYEIDLEATFDAVLIMHYFGYYNEKVEQIIKKLLESGKTIIEDATHSWFSERPFSSYSDYVFASFRKWTGLPAGAVAIKNRDIFKISLPNNTNNRYLALRQNATQLKKRYINNGIGEKELFLNTFNQAEELLENDYRNYNLPKEFEDIIQRLDIDKLKQRRMSNAKYIISAINDLKGIKTVSMGAQDVPLFVPIILPEGTRNDLQQYLIKNDVFCPVHWPLSVLHKTENKTLYENSLSLVCDQRYNTHEIENMIKLIREFFGG